MADGKDKDSAEGATGKGKGNKSASGKSNRSNNSSKSKNTQKSQPKSAVPSDLGGKPTSSRTRNNKKGDNESVDSRAHDFDEYDADSNVGSARSELLRAQKEIDSLKPGAKEEGKDEGDAGEEAIVIPDDMDDVAFAELEREHLQQLQEAEARQKRAKRVLELMTIQDNIRTAREEARTQEWEARMREKNRDLQHRNRILHQKKEELAYKQKILQNDEELTSIMEQQALLDHASKGEKPHNRAQKRRSGRCCRTQQ